MSWARKDYSVYFVGSHGTGYMIYYVNKLYVNYVMLELWQKPLEGSLVAKQLNGMQHVRFFFSDLQPTTPGDVRRSVTNRKSYDLGRDDEGFSAKFGQL